MVLLALLVVVPILLCCSIVKLQVSGLYIGVDLSTLFVPSDQLPIPSPESGEKNSVPFYLSRKVFANRFTSLGKQVRTFSCQNQVNHKNISCIIQKRNQYFKYKKTMMFRPIFLASVLVVVVAPTSAFSTAFITTNHRASTTTTTAAISSSSVLSMTANESGEKVVGKDGITDPAMIKDSAKESSIVDKATNAAKNVRDKVTNAPPGFGTQEMLVNDDGITSPDMVKDDAKGREAFGGSSSSSSSSDGESKNPIEEFGEKLSEFADSRKKQE